MGRVGFEPTKCENTADLQSAAFDRSAIFTILHYKNLAKINKYNMFKK